MTSSSVALNLLTNASKVPVVSSDGRYENLKERNISCFHCAVKGSTIMKFALIKAIEMHEMKLVNEFISHDCCLLRVYTYTVLSH